MSEGRMSPREDALKAEIQDLQAQIQCKKSEIEHCVDQMEEGKKSRERARKELLLREMKLILGRMKVAEDKVAKELKNEAFDNVRNLGKNHERLQKLLDIVQSSAASNASMTEFNAIKHQVEVLRKEDIAPSWFYDLSVGSSLDPCILSSFNRNVNDRLFDSIFLQTPVFSPKSFVLAHPYTEDGSLELNSNYIEVDIKINSNLDNVLLTPFLMRSMTVVLNACTDGSSLTTIEECSVWAKVQAGKARVADDGKSVAVKMKKPALVALCSVSARLFETNICGSPLFQHITNRPGSGDLVLNVTTGPNDLTLGVFDQDLDRSDYGSILSKNPLQPGYGKFLANHCFPASSTVPTACRTSDEARGLMFAIDTSQAPGPPQARSTLRPGAAAMQLELVRPGEEVVTLPPSAQNISTLPMFPAMESSILDPTKKSSVSVEEAQASLSDSESLLDRTRQEQSANLLEAVVGLDRSVSFAPHTSMVSVLATPQVQPGEPRFITEEGVTKQTDGLSGGPVKRLYPAPSQISTAAPLLAPFVPPNASVPSVWDTSDVVEDERDEENDNCTVFHDTSPCDELSSYDTLNESKAPSPGKDFGTPDPAWNFPTSENISILPASLNKKTPFDNLDATIWNFDEETFIPPSMQLNVKFAELEECAVYPAQQLAVPGLGYMAAPHSVAYSPHWHMFLVSEPDYNRVGLYNADTFEFYDWLNMSDVLRRQRDHSPREMKTLKNGLLVLLTDKALTIFDSDFRFKVAFYGRFRGLAESGEGHIFTIEETLSGPFIKRISCGKKRARTFYSYDDVRIRLTILQEFQHWEQQAKPNFLLFRDNVLFVADPGLHKIYKVDLLDVNKQDVAGYYGCGPGQFSQPSGMVVDDCGNFLVCDRGNSRLTVLGHDLKHVKEIPLPAGLHTPISLLRWGKFVLVICQGNYAVNGGAVAWMWNKCK